MIICRLQFHSGRRRNRGSRSRHRWARESDTIRDYMYDGLAWQHYRSSDKWLFSPRHLFACPLNMQFAHGPSPPFATHASQSPLLPRQRTHSCFFTAPATCNKAACILRLPFDAATVNSLLHWLPSLDRKERTAGRSTRGASEGAVGFVALGYILRIIL